MAHLADEKSTWAKHMKPVGARLEYLDREAAADIAESERRLAAWAAESDRLWRSK